MQNFSRFSKIRIHSKIEIMESTVAKINLEHFRSNLKFIRSKMALGAKMCVAVKADAYGHGAVECAKVAVASGADFLAIARVSEGRELREAGIKSNLLLLSLCLPEEMDELVSLNITPLVFDEAYIELVSNAAKRAKKDGYPVHLAVDTGMGRIGCLPQEAGEIAQKIVSCGLHFGGICTHFSVSDSKKEKDESYTRLQFERFLFAIEEVRSKGIEPGIRHCAASAATLLRPEMHLDMCRPGIICYGYYPGDLSGSELKPVMSLVTRVSSIRVLPAGSCVSYGRTWKAEKDTRIAILPVGYADGLLRRHADSSVLILGKTYPIRGRICMDQCMIEIGDDKIERWSEAVIFGWENGGQSAQMLADRAHTISYEITCAIGKRVPRIFVDGK